MVVVTAVTALMVLTVLTAVTVLTVLITTTETGLDGEQPISGARVRIVVIKTHLAVVIVVIVVGVWVLLGLENASQETVKDPCFGKIVSRGDMGAI